MVVLVPLLRISPTSPFPVPSSSARAQASNSGTTRCAPRLLATPSRALSFSNSNSLATTSPLNLLSRRLLPPRTPTDTRVPSTPRAGGSPQKQDSWTARASRGSTLEKSMWANGAVFLVCFVVAWLYYIAPTMTSPKLKWWGLGFVLSLLWLNAGLCLFAPKLRGASEREKSLGARGVDIKYRVYSYVDGIVFMIVHMAWTTMTAGSSAGSSALPCLFAYLLCVGLPLIFMDVTQPAGTGLLRNLRAPSTEIAYALRANEAAKVVCVVLGVLNIVWSLMAGNPLVLAMQCFIVSAYFMGYYQGSPPSTGGVMKNLPAQSREEDAGKEVSQGEIKALTRRIDDVKVDLQAAVTGQAAMSKDLKSLESKVHELLVLVAKDQEKAIAREDTVDGALDKRKGGGEVGG